jgi:hypothetical protein
MFGKIAIMALVLVLTSCEKPQETHDEDRLTYSFRDESPEITQHVATIVEDARALKYKMALNKLALLSATRKLTKEQKYAVDTLARQLRYDMEEKIFTERQSRELRDE